MPLQSLQPPVWVFVSFITFQLRNDPPQLIALQLKHFCTVCTLLPNH